MVRYRRHFVPGGTYFFTVALLARDASTLVDYVDELRASFQAVRRNRPFVIDAAVVLPDHLHAVWTLPEGDADFPARWRAIKSGFVRRVAAAGGLVGRNRRGEALVWQRRFWEHAIRDERDFRMHVDYIHFNPVKHDLVKRVRDWPHSSFHRYVACGDLPEDWADSPDEDALPGVGEPR